jgi:DeoR family transcriptional regulator, fructose operon transcriptional repressor
MESVADNRRSLIVQEVARSRQIKVVELSQRFGVSQVVIRRDLLRLEQYGLLKRVHGGAIALPRASGGYSTLNGAGSHIEEKERIGRAAAQFVHSGDQIILDSGSTVLELARHLSGDLLNRGNLTVITNSLHIVSELGPWNGVHLMLLGGIYLPEYDIVVGPKTVESLKDLRVDRTFVGAKGISVERGTTTSNVLEAEADRAAVESASEVILLADSSKIGSDSLTPVVPLSKIHKFITDTNAPADFVARMRDMGIEVILV